MNDRDTVKKSIDAIEPESGAKERMLSNIKAKADTEKSETKSSGIKNALHYLPLVACFAFAIIALWLLPKDDGTAVMSDEPGIRTAQHTEDRVEYVDGLEDILRRLGIEPQLPDGAEVTSCAVMDGDTADIRFEWHGKSFELLCVKLDEGEITLPGEEIASDFIESAELGAREVDGSTYLVLSWEHNGVSHRVISAECSSDDMRTLYYSLP